MKIKIITPIWTGDIDLKSDWLHSTGIIGSLRWWTEAILRGMRKFACDPAGDERCPKKIKDEMQYCPACLIFGATGIRRLFRLEISGGEKIFDGGAINIKPQQRNRGWYLGSGLKGEIDLNIIPLDRDFDENLVLVPLAIAAKWGGIGAKTQHGYGVVELIDKIELRFENFQGALDKILKSERLRKLNIKERNDTNDALPNIKEMFFAKVQFEVQNNDWWKEVDGIKPVSNDQRLEKWIETGSVPISPAIKNWLRYDDGKNLWQDMDTNKKERKENWLFGTTDRVCSSCYEKVNQDRNNRRNFWCSNCRKSLKKEETFERVASKINVSCAYRINNTTWEFRIWGWIPEGFQGFNRNNFLNNLKQALDGNGTRTIPWTSLLGKFTKNHKLKVWREFNPPNESVINNYLQSLLEDKGGS
ncbi:MAG: type III-B CRISPR module RAMP protein Cmr1 [candidate division WOR-3 bacterium]